MAGSNLGASSRFEISEGGGALDLSSVSSVVVKNRQNMCVLFFGLAFGAWDVGHEGRLRGDLLGLTDEQREHKNKFCGICSFAGRAVYALSTAHSLDAPFNLRRGAGAGARDAPAKGHVPGAGERACTRYRSFPRLPWPWPVLVA